MNTSAVCGAAAAVAALAGPAAAAELSFEAGGDAVLVAGGFSGPDAEPLAARTSLFAEAAWLFANGLEAAIGARAAAERDHPTAGVVRAGPAVCGVRAPVSDGVRCSAPASLASAATVEALYVRLAGPWGEASLGRDEGVASRYAQRPPSLAQALTLTDPRLSLTATPAPRVLNDPAGPSAKVTVESPRLLGLKAGLSFTPEEEGRDLADAFAAAPRVRLENVAEGALSFYRAWPRGLATTAGVSFAQGEAQGGLAGFGDLKRAAVSARLEAGGWAVGASHQWSDNGWAAGGRDYRASAGAVQRAFGGAWSASLGAAHAEDALLGLDVTTVQAELGRNLGERAGVVLALRREDAGAAETGIFAELSLKL